MTLFWKYVRKYKKGIICAIFFLAIADLAQILMPGLIRDAVRGLVSENARMSDFTRTALWVFGVVFVTALCRMMWRIVLWPVGRRVEYDIRGDLLLHLQKVDPGYYHAHASGDLMSRATSDVDAVRMFFSMGFVVFFDFLMVLPIAMVLMIRTDPVMGLTVAVPILIAPVFSLILLRRLSLAFRLSQDELGVLSGRAQEDITGVRVIKTYAREDACRKNYRKQNLKTRGAFLKVSRLHSLIGPYFHLVPQVAVLLLVIVCNTAWMAGKYTAGEIVQMQAFSGLLSWPTFALGWGITMLQRMRSSMARVQEVLDEPARERARIDKGPDRIDGHLDFRNLTFCYGKGAPVLTRVNLNVECGTLLGMTGPTGSGKSTLLSLAVNLIEAPRHSIFLDGIDIRDIAPEKLRRHIALVQQEPFLFSRPLRENLAFARPEAADEDVYDAVVAAGLEPDLNQFDAGLNTLVGDRGVTLSGGQRLRVALGRALVADPQVLLIDDAFAAVDVRTEEQVWNTLRKRMAGRTVVVVSHRISVLRRCDRIAVLENGTISQQGSHSELIDRDGFYSRTFALQELFEQ